MSEKKKPQLSHTDSFAVGNGWSNTIPHNNGEYHDIIVYSPEGIADCYRQDSAGTIRFISNGRMLSYQFEPGPSPKQMVRLARKLMRGWRPKVGAA